MTSLNCACASGSATVRGWRSRITFLTFLVFCAFTVSARDALLKKRSARYRLVAKKANQATVGIYCSENVYLSYYGTGAIVSEDGYVLTSTTVVPPGAKDIRIFMADHRHFEAEIVEINRELESALLKMKSKGPFPHFPVADNLPAIGERAYSLGNAHNMIRMGEQASFSVGAISGIYPVKSIDTQSSYQGLAIETDAAINPGQDGGPLLNSSAQLVGIVSLSYSDSRWQGVAVSIQQIRKGLGTVRDGSVKFSNERLVEPLPGDGPTARGLAGHARGIAKALVKIFVERTFPPEKMPRLSLTKFIQSHTGFDDRSDREKQAIVGRFYDVDSMLATNQQIRRPAGAVTGMLISADGYILTSSFNIALDGVWKHKTNAVRLPEFSLDIQALTRFDPQQYGRIPNSVKKIEVELPNGKRLPATIVARHYPAGIALLKVQATDLPYIDLETRLAKPKTGEACGVIGIGEGKPGYTLNTGMVSSEERQRKQKFQFDAIINYGNSGGPVIGADGRIFGIAGAPLSPGPTMGRIYGKQEILRWSVAPNSGVSFGARGDRIRAALPALMKGQTVRFIKGAFLGISPDMNRLLDKEVRIEYVLPDSAADKAGLRKDDIVEKVDGRKIDAWRMITERIDKLSPGDMIEMQVLRPGKQRYMLVNGKRIYNADDYEAFTRKLKDGDAIFGKFVEVDNERLTLKVKLGKRSE